MLLLALLLRLFCEENAVYRIVSKISTVALDLFRV
jgi:hypothetical protein